MNGIGKALESLRFQGFFWQREKDLNPHKQSQSLSCYPYTIPLYAARRLTSAGFIIPKSARLSIPFFKKIRGTGVTHSGPVYRRENSVLLRPVVLVLGAILLLVLAAGDPGLILALVLVLALSVLRIVFVLHKVHLPCCVPILPNNWRNLYRSAAMKCTVPNFLKKRYHI
jgi:hypothetical protein